MPIIKESVVVIASPGFGNFFDETDPMFEKPQNRKRMNIIRQGRRDALFLDAIFKVLVLIQALTPKEFSVRYPKITFHHLFPGFVKTYALENQGFPPHIIAWGEFAKQIIAADADDYCDVPVSKAIASSTSGGFFTSQQYGWRVPLEKWAQNENKRKTLFEWALQRAQTAAKTKPPEDKIVETK
jgi:hypothetical protein